MEVWLAWLLPFVAAVTEVDSSKAIPKIREAKWAIAARRYQRSIDVEEMEILKGAIRTLKALRVK
jgi:hypothetical protein